MWERRHLGVVAIQALLVAAWCVGWMSCGASSDDRKLPYSAPVWGEPPAERLLIHAPGLSLQGDARVGRFEDRAFQGYRLYGGRYTTVTLELDVIDGRADPVLVVYGPRTSGSLWGRALIWDDDGGRGRNARIGGLRLDARGEFLIMVSTYDNAGAGGYRLRVRCSEGCSVAPCPELACFEELAGRCSLGYANDARGCRACGCFEECQRPEDCGPSKICVRGQCLDDCQCQDELAPVCGADGVTYGSRCEASCRGVAVAGEGACPEECPPLECALECALGYVVEQGCPVCACEEEPCALCEEGGEPVCTRNGLTYANACRASCEGEILAYAGRCDPACPLLDCDLACEAGLERGDDGCPVCVCALPVCPDTLEPVCGVDGLTRNNLCELERAGVKEAFAGACPPLCEGDAGCPQALRCSSLDPEAGCEPGSCLGSCVLSEVVPGFCTRSDDCPLGLPCRDGVCEPIVSCSPQYDPVCSPEGRTWLNDCYARNSGVEGFRAGACCPDELLDGCDARCDNGFVVDGDGCAICRCREVPPCECQPADNPVCGVDGRTYPNPCEARCAGVEIRDRGACAAP